MWIYIFALIPAAISFYIILVLLMRNRALMTDLNRVLEINTDLETLLVQADSKRDLLRYESDCRQVLFEKAREHLETAVQERNDAWALLELLLKENMENYKTPENILAEVGRDGVHYVFAREQASHKKHFEAIQIK